MSNLSVRIDKGRGGGVRQGDKFFGAGLFGAGRCGIL